MNNLSLVDRVVLFLKQNSLQIFTAREIAIKLVQLYPEYFQQKRLNSQQVFNSDAEFINQIVAEIGSRIKNIALKDENIKIQDQPRPRTYCYRVEDNRMVSAFLANREEKEENNSILVENKQDYSEEELYPLLMQYLEVEYHQISHRIDEKCSKKDKGKYANHWLHPDIVAMQPITEQWGDVVKECIRAEGGKTVYLWSFEVKKQLNRSTVRESFFQAVSNSSWANYGYLVCSGIADDGSMNELRMLSALHGIGVIVLDIDNITESEIVIPALFKSEVDWSSVNRLVEENDDMKRFIQRVTRYYKGGYLQI